MERVMLMTFGGLLYKVLSTPLAIGDGGLVGFLGAKEGTEVTAVTSKLKFVHYLQSCVLTTTGKQLPKWAYEQQEVTCNPNIRDPNGYWNVEENTFDKCMLIPTL